MTPELLDDRLSDHVLKVGESLTTTFSMLLLIPESELGPPIRDYGEGVPDPSKPRTFDEWIRSRFTSPAIERELNARFAGEGKTTRVEVDRAEILSTRPAASERPELKGTGVGIQRAEIRVTMRVTHNELISVLGILFILAIGVTAIAVAGAAGHVIDKFTEKGPRFLGDLGAGAGKLSLGLLALGLALPLLLKGK